MFSLKHIKLCSNRSSIGDLHTTTGATTGIGAGVGQQQTFTGWLQVLHVLQLDIITIS